MQKSFIKITCALLIIGLNWTGFLAIGQTFALFNDIENSNNNTYTAGSLDLTARSGQSNFVPGAEEMSHGDQVNRDIYIGKTAASLPLKHMVSYELIDGDENFCNQLDLKIWYNHYHCQGSYADCRDMRLTYNGKLSLLNEYTDPDFIIPHSDDKFDIDSSDGTEQWFYYSIIVPNGIDDSFQGKVCDFKFVFEGWQNNVVNYDDGGFSDVEEIESVIKTGYWEPFIVLNEFLPNAADYLEYVEIFNMTGSTVDLSGFYVQTEDSTGSNINIIPIDDTTTNNIYNLNPGSTTIPAPPNGWLVVATGGDLINNSSGTITLYNKNDIVVDTYTYAGPAYNINNSPGETNNLVAYLPFDGNFLDLSGNGNDGANNGAAFVAGKINQALDFDGIDDYMTIANSDDFDFGSGEFSVEFWTKTDSSSRQWVGTRYENYGPGWGLGTQNSHTLGYIRTSEGGTSKTEVEGIVDVADNAWHHLVMVRAGDKIKIYTDGSFEAEGTLASDVDNDEPIEIGRISWSGGSQYFKGLIDEVKIYDRALNDLEIGKHYNDVSTPSGEVPVDKSYARIPDGIGDWIDPIPTPGGFNKLSAEEKAKIFTPAEVLYTPILNYTPAVGVTIEVPATDNTSTTDDVIDVPATDNTSTTDDVIDVPATDNASTTDDVIDVPATDVNSGSTDPVVDIDDVVGVTPTGTEPVEPTDPPADEPPAENDTDDDTNNEEDDNNNSGDNEENNDK